MNYDKDTVMEDIAMMRKVYSEIDKMIPSFIEAEIRLEESLKQKNAIENKYKGKNFVIFCFLLSMVLLFPLCILSIMKNIQLFWFAPAIAAIGVWIYGRYYEKKQMPILLSGNEKVISSANEDRNNLMNMINQSHYNVEMEFERLVRSTENDDFLELIDTEGVPVECYNLVALDYMYCALKRGYAESFADALLHFRELKEKLNDMTDEDSKKLMKDIVEGELRGEYRNGYIKHCGILREAVSELPTT